MSIMFGSSVEKRLGKSEHKKGSAMCGFCRINQIIESKDGGATWKFVRHSPPGSSRSCDNSGEAVHPNGQGLVG